MSKKIKRVYVDPPNGHLYGFPKVVPDEYVEDGGIVEEFKFDKWLSDNYPEEVYYFRIWVKEEEI